MSRTTRIKDYIEETNTEPPHVAYTASTGKDVFTLISTSKLDKHYFTRLEKAAVDLDKY